MEWIVIRNWDKFQHYKDREPVWIKLYTELNSDPEWLGLTTAERGMLTTIWVEYARSRGVLQVTQAMQLCGKSARSKHLRALNHAGFIEFSASKPLALARSREREEEKEKERRERAVPNIRPSRDVRNGSTDETFDFQRAFEMMLHSVDDGIRDER